MADEEWYANVPFEGGEALFQSDSRGIAEDALSDLGVEEFFDRMGAPEESEEEIGQARGLLVPGAGLIVRADLEEISDELIRHLTKHPELMHKLGSRKFEELVAQLLKDKGYEVELTPRTRDGGLDIRAFRRSDIGTILTLADASGTRRTTRWTCKSFAWWRRKGRRVD
jgi:hypothetical protein